ncbi:nitrite reductase small subunit NirD [Ponticoccus alexandrii]|uniref:Nitrite reductase small subunit NirD n=1 Tax=Ponticoccus alexandrii TaxID=1943633 RepID=A0ABX7FGM7_9RHOB|nr:nitrite reductase small subunit NirD [Ponticoccus alexandrii]ETA49599.1 tRNA-(guanine-N1)-methyltransferase [Rhodobacteraceae bacterium PD-2]QRF68888.1 nitrite reductase small subunit NirD [Ponticoccus alexandrii]
MSWIDLGPLDAVPERGARIVKTRAGCIALFRTGPDEVFAASNTCPHKGGPLSEGIVHGRQVTCPLHNWVFDLETGEAQGADRGRIATYPLRIVQGRILIDGNSLAVDRAA